MVRCPKLLSVPAAAERLGVPEGTLRDWIFRAQETGLKKVLVRIKRRVLLDEARLAEWVEDQRGRDPQPMSWQRDTRQKEAAYEKARATLRNHAVSGGTES